MKKLIVIAVSMLVVSNAVFSLDLSRSCKSCIHSCNKAGYADCAKLCHANSNFDCQKFPAIKKVKEDRNS